MKTGLVYLVAVGILATIVQAKEGVQAKEKNVDPVTGMKIAENWKLVRYHCTQCHSAKQFLRQRGNRRTWASIIEWMQMKQGLWSFDPATEDKLLTYLSENYPPSETYRRAPIPATLMPPNPYVSQTKRAFEAKKAEGLAPVGPKDPPG